MAQPWSIPPLPQYGDKDIDTTYAAVGRALSAWEEIEVWLAVLYARFLEIPPIQAINLPSFRNAAIFHVRSQQVQDAASAFFMRHPNQALEKEFEELICDINKLSQRRNDIAHGIVRLGATANPSIPP